MIETLRQLWDLGLKFLYFIALLLLLITGVELAKIFLFMHRIHPVLGVAYAVGLTLFLVGSFLYFRKRLGRLPRVLDPPVLDSLEDASQRDLIRFLKYQRAYLQRLHRNPSLTPEVSDRASAAAGEVDGVLQAHPLRDDLQREIVRVDEDCIRPCLKQLNDLSDREIRRCVRDVMLAVTLSPYRMIDILVVLYRNGSMIMRVAQIYESRPGLRAQLRILNDTVRVVATVNFINLSRNLIEGLFSRMPVVGHVADDIGQGIGAGFFTSLAGHAATYRCAAYDGWAYQDAVEGLGHQSKQFLDDVRGIFLKNVLPQMRGRISVGGGETPATEAGVIDSMTRAVNGAFDSSVKVVNDLMVRPAVSGTQTVWRTGNRMVFGDGEPETPERVVERRHKSHSRKVKRSGPRRLMKTFGQRLRYGLFKGDMR